jgi:hypothetical protein
MLDAFNAVQAQLQNGVSPANVTEQPWILNQLNLAIPNVCGPNRPANLSPRPNCTAFIANALGYASLFETGGAADVVGGLFTQGASQRERWHQRSVCRQLLRDQFGSLKLQRLARELAETFFEGI